MRIYGLLFLFVFLLTAPLAPTAAQPRTETVTAQPQAETAMVPPQAEAAAAETPATPVPAKESPLSAQDTSLQMEDRRIAVLRTIDKMSARTHTFEIPVDQTVKFGDSLFIKARACRKSSPLAQPESAAFLQIWERKPGTEDASWIFSGWMFASSPSLSPMNHPVYDVWVIDCKNASTSEKSGEASAEQPLPPSETPEAESPALEKPAAPEEPPAVVSEPAAAPEAAQELAPGIENLPSSFEDGAGD